VTGSQWTVAELLPHTGPALLLDEVIDWTDLGITTTVTIGPDTPFRGDHGVPAHVGLEYMAQTCGAFSGAMARRAGGKPKPGYLLGTRRFLATRAWFREGERLLVSSELVYRDQQVGVFDCLIRSGNEVVAKAQLIVSEPENVAEMIDRQGGTDA
jgi:predicted hotdog family 3-hydroxylacyl-ACP dehydratase